jgi:UDP-N-acetylglucosamine diphosphorylase/glucosamine-1-phosphate N-acetyltransferase
MKLYLLEPMKADGTWAPFADVRPISELRAGVWKIRERWEAALDLETDAIIGPNLDAFFEGSEPRVLTDKRFPDGGLAVASWFAPTGAPVELRRGTRRLTHGGETVGWVIEPGAAIDALPAAGEMQDIDGLSLQGTFDLITALDRYLAPDCLGFGSGPVDPVPAGSLVLGDPALVLSRKALVEPGVVFDTRDGAIVLEQGAEVRSGSRLEGPLYVGERSRILGGPVRHSVLGPRSNVRGEVTDTVFLGFANKAHEGFVGHSVLGHWVNLGAGTTTSNLKNTYGEVSLQVRGERFATHRQFLGSLIGDHAKTAIGTLLPTGTVIGAGANVFGPGPVPKYVPPMAWGSDGTARMSEEGFLKVAERVMPRREVAMTPERRASLAAIYRRVSTR